MQYELVFDVSDRIPEIALAAAALVALVFVLALGLWRFDDLLGAWPVLIVAALALVVARIVLSRSTSEIFWLWPIGIATAGELLRDRLPVFGSRRVPRGGLPVMFGLFSLLFVALSGLGVLPAIGLSQQLDAGAALVLEGQVTNFFDVSGGKNECFSVQARRFCYSDFAITPGFNRTRAYGGPIQPGAVVRLAAIGDQIVRLEIATNR